MPETPDAIILLGGFGLRLREVIADAPKPMAQIGGRPFMELLLKQLKRHGLSRAILSVGYKHELIRDRFGDNACGLELVYSVEAFPLGTGGALREAARYLRTETALILNGDSYTNVDLERLVQEHVANGADVTVVVIPETRSDAGSVVLDNEGRINAFAEKRMIPESRYLSAGIYMLNKSLLGTISSVGKVSLEEHLFPQWLAEGRSIRGFVFQGPCIDIGTPERYQRALAVLDGVELNSVLESEGQS